ncbi:TIGR02281 family clan AA aspartic protease [Lichenibacterium ramalinae]|uniref:TIGR02281 family clan AA aspartic protease n=1 Tax=Lichenibacterium ramalinae TaxID=2316527 RepID=A0A4Q2RB53_9HYPH|nr:TIGR02281 family clan AA aspartic protease [Lichenibacterium ramalinae]RYB02860.1 TIGR02281 family clan AA aspartic protease [Lichenibacterium ramalinae]
MDRVPVDWSELTADDWTRLAVYGAFATSLAVVIPGLFRGRILAGLASLGLWVVLLAAVLAGYAYRFELGTVAERVLAVLMPGTVVETGPREVTVFRRPDGGFTIDGSVGKVRVPFTLDTGASSVVLRWEDALRLKIPVRQLAYDVEVMTANGRGLAAEVLLPSLTIGPLTQTNVRALVEKAGALHENLLGMSYLNKLESFTVSNDKLVMRGR